MNKVAELIIDGAQKLHSCCDGAQELDGVGFAASDVSVGWALADMTAEELLGDPEMMAGAASLLANYSSTQLDSGDFGPLWYYLNSLEAPTEPGAARVRAAGKAKYKAHRDAEKAAKAMADAKAARKIRVASDGIALGWPRNDPQFNSLYAGVKTLQARFMPASNRCVVLFDKNNKADVLALV